MRSEDATYRAAIEEAHMEEARESNRRRGVERFRDWLPRRPVKASPAPPPDRSSVSPYGEQEPW